ncbi:MAG: hypothetical protein AB8H86_16870 [Polyangiales bacterium]
MEDASVDGSSRVVETNLGYRVGVDRLYVAVGALELVPCDQEATLEASWMDLFAASRAFADHGWVSDSTRLEPLLVENALGEESSVAAQSAGTSYCELSWTLTPVEGAAADGFELLRASVLFEGWFQAPGDTERTPLSAELRVGRGTIVPLVGNWSRSGKG